MFTPNQAMKLIFVLSLLSVSNISFADEVIGCTLSGEIRMLDSSRSIGNLDALMRVEKSEPLSENIGHGCEEKLQSDFRFSFDPNSKDIKVGSTVHLKWLYIIDPELASGSMIIITDIE